LPVPNATLTPKLALTQRLQCLIERTSRDRRGHKITPHIRQPYFLRPITLSAYVSSTPSLSVYHHEFFLARYNLLSLSCCFCLVVAQYIAQTLMSTMHHSLLSML